MEKFAFYVYSIRYEVDINKPTREFALYKSEEKAEAACAALNAIGKSEAAIWPGRFFIVPIPVRD